jgi:hypothetical protein
MPVFQISTSNLLGCLFCGVKLTPDLFNKRGYQEKHFALDWRELQFGGDSTPGVWAAVNPAGAQENPS